MADFGGEAAEAFRGEVRDWLKAHFSPTLKGRSALMYMEGAAPADGDVRAWTGAMGETGWGVPTWPKAYGGGGLDAAAARILQQEMNGAGAWNPIGGMGVMMFGPTLLEYGNEEQKAKYVPGIVKGTTWW
ncbi:MAG TPA: acyl-CoA dehydrogenase family protein, partial [Caulobacteraceae bacterium]